MRIDDLRNELAAVRKTSLAASQKGDFMKVARMTAKAAQLNKEIYAAENGVSVAEMERAQATTQDRPDTRRR